MCWFLFSVSKYHLAKLSGKPTGPFQSCFGSLRVCFLLFQSLRVCSVRLCVKVVEVQNVCGCPGWPSFHPSALNLPSVNCVIRCSCSGVRDGVVVRERKPGPGYWEHGGGSPIIGTYVFILLLVSSVTLCTKGVGRETSLQHWINHFLAV